MITYYRDLLESAGLTVDAFASDDGVTLASDDKRAYRVLHHLQDYAIQSALRATFDRWGNSVDVERDIPATSEELRAWIETLP